MLHLRAHACLEVFPTFCPSTRALVANGLNRGALGGNEKCSLAALQLVAFFRTGVAAVAEHAVFLAVQQCVRHRDIGHVGCGALHVVYQPGKFIHPNVRLHPEIPLVALLGLMHLRVARTIGILGRTGRSDQRRIDDRARPQALPLARQMGVDRFQHPSGNAVGFQQTAKVENRGLVLEPYPSRRAGQNAAGSGSRAMPLPSPDRSTHTTAATD
ncbi:unknown protein [Xanthomonas oryzae pv. oryzae KACC 10331]|uniref:Uncharacterized protein n=1 Tax=Xanthomonas oryzae pv. oryzae (strain KACC10331 / KXO85) TaxID=291331 RepID=Q5GY76_XANOR|nr:unknown protein [Xanthomonas oryzae pv. oryzae KACC 10331]